MSIAVFSIVYFLLRRDDDSSVTKKEVMGSPGRHTAEVKVLFAGVL